MRMNINRNHKLLRRGAAMLLAGGLLLGSASAATWREGTSPAQPYLGHPAADLERTLGYFMLYPRARAAAQHYCDALVVYLPREDVAIGTGEIRLFRADGELLLTVDVADGESVTIDPMTEGELDSLMWGSGVAYRIHLPFSLALDTGYYVTMDQGTITVPGTLIINGPVEGTDRWQPAVEGEYGISGLSYLQWHEIDLADVGPETAEQEAEYVPSVKLNPEKGDIISFDLILGGEAATAAIYAPDDTVLFSRDTYGLADVDADGAVHVEGKVIGDELGTWGVIFLNEAGDTVHITLVHGSLDAE